MKITIASDLHLEAADINITNDNGADVLILAGDIMIAEDLHNHPAPATPYTLTQLADLGPRQSRAARFRDFLSRVSFQFPRVIMIAGNHEFYGGRWGGSLAHLKAEMARWPNIHFLENDSVTIDGVHFLGSTMWTDLNRGDPLTAHAITGILNDYRVIRVDDGDSWGKLRPHHTVIRHRDSVRWLTGKLQELAGDKVVVVTHHTPSFASCAEEYRGDHHTNGGYHTELSPLILDNPSIRLWVHGHTHHHFDYNIGDTRVVCNPRGYLGWDRGAEDWVPVTIEV